MTRGAPSFLERKDVTESAAGVVGGGVLGAAWAGGSDETVYCARRAYRTRLGGLAAEVSPSVLNLFDASLARARRKRSLISTALSGTNPMCLFAGLWWLSIPPNFK